VRVLILMSCVTGASDTLDTGLVIGSSIGGVVLAH
jgi:hypothetical protein